MLFRGLIKAKITEQFIFKAKTTYALTNYVLTNTFLKTTRNSHDTQFWILSHDQNQGPNIADDKNQSRYIVDDQCGYNTVDD